MIYDAAFIIKENSAGDENAFVILEYDYSKKEEGYPFAYHIEVTYLLQKNNSLAVTTKVINTGVTDMPLCDGWHPYFKVGDSINDAQIRINSKEMVEFNEGLLPTGKIISDSSFSTTKKLGDIFLDNCFVVNGHSNPACIIENMKTGLKLEIIPAASYPYLQVYTPPHRQSIAIENLSSAPDAFNNGMGLIIAKPGEQYMFETAFRLILTK